MSGHTIGRTDELFRHAFEVAPTAMVMASENGLIVKANAQTEKLFGYALKELIGQPVEILVPERFRAAHPERRQLFFSSPQARSMGSGRDLYGRRKDGSEVPIQIGLNLITTEDGPLALAAIIDITERCRADKDSRHLAAVIDSSDDAIITKDLNGVIQSWNKSAERIFGYSSEEIIGRSMSLLLPPERPDEEKCVLEKLRQGERVDHFETVRLRKDGQRINISVTISPIRDATGQITGASNVSRDVTQAKLSEKHRADQARLAELRADIGGSLTCRGSLPEQLHHCTAALVRHLDAASALIWTISETGDVLELQASACLNGPHNNAPFDQIKIEFIAAERKPYLTNQVVGDPRVGGQAWAQREGMVAFAGHPLIIDERVVGVLALFDRQPLPESTLEALSSIAEWISLGIERKRTETALLQAVNNAHAANRAKSDFLANMSHEIRTPMTAILGYADVLIEDSNIRKHASERISDVEIIKLNAEHLLKVVNDILDLSKIEAGQMTVESIRCQPSELVAEVASLMRVRAAAKGLSLMVEFDGPIPETIESDPTRVRQILINLIGNSIKFTKTGGVRLRISHRVRPVAISSSNCAENATASNIQFDVVDSGIGMTEEEMARMFRPFMQADASISRRFGGTGLGLAITKRLVEHLGGDITVSSVPGQGSTFSVSIATGDLSNVPFVDIESEANIRYRKTEPAIASLPPCRILLAEDSPVNQRLVSIILRKAGAEVVITGDGQSACQMAMAAHEESRPFDVILMDMQMPILDGYAAARLLREAGYRHPIVALTAHAMAGDEERCHEAGCDGFATKPIDRAALIRTISERLEAKDLSQKNAQY